MTDIAGVDAPRTAADWRRRLEASGLDGTTRLVGYLVAFEAEIAGVLGLDEPPYLALVDLADRLAITPRRADRAIAALETAGWLTVATDHAGYHLRLVHPQEHS